MALNVVSKINTRLRFLYRKNKLLSPQLRRLLCNALIQPYFDYACSVWYPNLNEKFKKKLQTLQNKCVHFCLQLGTKTHIGITEFKQINWLHVNSIAIFRDSLEYPFHHFLLQRTRFISRVNFLKATCIHSPEYHNIMGTKCEH